MRLYKLGNVCGFTPQILRRAYHDWRVIEVFHSLEERTRTRGTVHSGLPPQSWYQSQSCIPTSRRYNFAKLGLCCNVRSFGLVHRFPSSRLIGSQRPLNSFSPIQATPSGHSLPRDINWGTTLHGDSGSAPLPKGKEKTKSISPGGVCMELEPSCSVQPHHCHLPSCSSNPCSHRPITEHTGIT